MMQSYFNCYFLSYTKSSRTFVDSFSGFLHIKSSSLSVNVNLISQKRLYSEKLASHVTRHLTSPAESISILFVKRENTIRKNKFLSHSETNSRNGLPNVKHELTTQEPGEFIIILLPKLKLFEVITSLIPFPVLVIKFLYLPHNESSVLVWSVSCSSLIRLKIECCNNDKCKCIM